MAKGNKGSNVWMWIGCGCGSFLLLIGLGLGLMVYFGAQQMETIREDIENPVPKAQALLGFESLPEGYFVSVAFSVPMIADTVVLSDRQRDDHRDFESRGFIYSKIKVLKEKNSQELEDFFEGRSDDHSVLRRNHINIDLDPEDIIARGVLEEEGQSFFYVCTQGNVTTEHMTTRGLSTILLVRCPEDRKVRFGLWFGPENEPIAGDDVSYAGTPADPEAMRDFLGHFNFCL